jgi:hypothetical protein
VATAAAHHDDGGEGDAQPEEAAVDAEATT